MLNPGADDRPEENAADQQTHRLRGLLFAALVAALGGALGIVGAFFQELQSGGLLVAFAGAPLIEEGLKPAGVYILLIRWPRLLTSQLKIAMLAAVGGLSFGFVESLVYVKLYFSDASSDLVLFRFTVTPLLHATTSFIVGLGLRRQVIEWADGKAAFPRPTRNAYAAAVTIHAAYNITAIALAVSGVFDLE